MKEKIAAIDDLIQVCERAIAGPAKSKRDAAAKPKEPTKQEENDDGMEELLELHSRFKE